MIPNMLVGHPSRGAPSHIMGFTVALHHVSQVDVINKADRQSCIRADVLLIHAHLSSEIYAREMRRRVT